MLIGNKISFTLVSLLVIGLSASLVSATSDSGEYTIETNQNIDTLTIWKDMTQNLTESVTIGGSGELRIINSIIDISDAVHGIVINGGNLTVIDSTILFDGIDHAVFGETTGRLNLTRATLSSTEGDAVHLEGNYHISITGSTFQNSGDDGLHVEENNIPFTVDNCTFINNGDDGFDLLEVGTDATLLSSIFINNKGHAIKAKSTQSITVDDIFMDGGESTIADDNRGFDVEDTGFISVENVIIQNFPNDGIKFRRTPSALKNITITNVGDEGIEIENAIGDEAFSLDYASITNAYGGDGIKIEVVDGTISINNTRVLSAGDDGIQITSGNTIAAIQNTYIEESFEDGLEIDSVPLIIFRNVTSTRNIENGIKLKNLNTVDIADVSLVKNSFMGLSGVNVSNIEIVNSNFSNNVLDGFSLASANTSTIYDSVFVSNSGSDLLSNGISMESVKDFFINGSRSESNSGSGIFLSNSDGYIQLNNIETNSVDGIEVSGLSNVEILNNHIKNNGRNGISLSNHTNAIIQYNSFSGNEQYGLYVINGINYTVNADYNYWGSDDGPNYQKQSSDQQDGIFGEVEINHILDAEGNSVDYVPPSIIDFEILFYILIIIILIGSVGGIIVYFYLNYRWRKTTKPLALIYMNQGGVPLQDHLFTDASIDSILVSGFLTAVTNFGAELYKEQKASKIGKSTREIQSEENIIILRKVGTGMMSIIVGSSNRLVKKQFLKFINEFSDHVKLVDGETFDQKVEHVDPNLFSVLVMNYFGIFNYEDKI